MIAVTIAVGEKYELMAAMAAESCRHHTGLETHILGVSHMRKYGLAGNPMLLRYKLFDEFPGVGSILHFDADMIFRRRFDPVSLVPESHLGCVRDCHSKPFIKASAKIIGIPARDYFNGGFLLLHRGAHHRLLRIGEKYLALGCSPFRGQCPLNWSRRLLGLPVSYLPKSYNHIVFQDQPDGDGAIIGHFISHNLKHLSQEEIRTLYDAHSTIPLTRP